jgi:1-acyl-sn-glycerol-3-phosphate acyltransferase
MRVFLRGLILVGSIARYLVGSAVMEASLALRKESPIRRQKMRASYASVRSKKLLKTLGFRVQIHGLDRFKGLSSNALLAANHLSFWDALILSAELESVTFITSVEVKNTPVIGRMVQSAGCVFVERRNRSQLNQELNTITQGLMEGQNIVLFPEATSTNGSRILPFKRAFFRSAVDASKPVVPICLNYLSIDGKPLNSNNRDCLFYYGDQNIVVQLCRVLKLFSVTVEVRVLDPLNPSDWDTDQATPNPETALQERSYQQIVNQFVPIS